MAPRYIQAPERRGTYAVLEAFRYNGRNFEPGMDFDARRLDVRRGRLDTLYRGGYIGLPDEEADEEYREERAEAAKNWQPPQPIAEAEEELEPLPEEGEDFEE